MNRYASRLVLPMIVAFFVMLACGLTIALQHKRATAQAAPTCNILMVVDTSGSVGQDNNNVSRMKAQMKAVVENLAEYKDEMKVNLGLWSFSSVIDPGNANYNSPVMGYTNVVGPVILQSIDALNIVPKGGTNYEQGFGYHGYALDTQRMNANQDIQNLAKSADVLVFMTDGVPNTPASSGSTGDNNQTAIRAAKAAYNALVKFNQDNKGANAQGLKGFTEAVMVGSDVNAAALNYIINSEAPNPPNPVGSITQVNGSSVPHVHFTAAGYHGLVSVITPVMEERCRAVTGVESGDPYSLNPSVTSTDAPAAAGEASASFSYNVNSSIESGKSSSSGWKIEKLIIPKGQTANGLMFGQRGNCGYDSTTPSDSVPYCDGIAGCTQLVAYIGGTGGGRSCSDIASGTTSFGHGGTSLNEYAGDGLTATIDDSYPIGTKICYVLIVNKPTQRTAPRDRASRAACLTIGKKPSVQVHGGDLRVGRSFAGDAATAEASENGPLVSEINTSVTAKSDGNSYGSWVEYGAMAPGAITGFASMSGLADGYPSNQPDSQQFWSQLTFANVQNQFGYFTEANNGQGTIPNYAAAILAVAGDKKEAPASGDLELGEGDNVGRVLYSKRDGDLTLKASMLGKGESVVVYVPNGTVKIEGNLTYSDGPYSSVDEIPQLVIIAKTINIGQDVANVDAWLIANSADDGTVTTCDDPATLTINVCSQLLTINGPVIANHLNLRRTGGAGINEASAQSAETIVLPGSTYLWSQAQGRSDARAQTTYTTEMPPYF